VERNLVLNSETHNIETVDKEVLNVTNEEEDPRITVYITDEKFYEWVFLYGERGLGESFSNKYFTTDLLPLFEIIHGIKSYEWTLHKYFVDGYMEFNKLPCDEIDYKHIKDGKEYMLFVDKLENESENEYIIIHNGLFDFKHTFVEKFHPTQFITTDSDLFVLKYEKMERVLWEPSIEDGLDEKTLYYATFIKFLFKKKYLSYNHLFCKK